MFCVSVFALFAKRNIIFLGVLRNKKSHITLRPESIQYADAEINLRLIFISGVWVRYWSQEEESQSSGKFR